ncbi:alkaline phosphatase family protein [Pseudomonas putida]|uniref:alkaline phosphatase family protein n=1 Tax=Pseudomonas putida TaxID=303 RepID=UPI0023647D07|nr:alkaline phosphatase family protein [Pseudomonas putida]MDD1968935.1 alkaline phosphatase family protein [Pseudomonas putida]
MYSIARLCGIALLLGLLAALLLKNMLLGDSVDFHRHKALLIGVDGVQYEQLKQAIDAGHAPVIAGLRPMMTYTGGMVGTSTQQTTFSGPGWATVLTGAWADRHRIASNDSGLRIKTDSLFKLISLSSPTRHTASIVSWNPINDNFADDISAGFIELGVKCGGDDQCATERTVQELRTGNFDFIFVHLDQPDDAGHENGFGPGYQDAIAKTDKQIGLILDALGKRKRENADEDWLVMVTTDHGRRLPDGYDHGEQSRSEKTAFIGLNKPANEQLTQPISDPDNPALNGLYGLASEADVVPTILTHLGINTDPQRYTIDGVPLIGHVGVRQLGASLNAEKRTVELRWRVTEGSKQPLRIYRAGQLIAKLTDSSSQYIDSDLPQPIGQLNYTVVFNEVPVSVLVSDKSVKR